MLSWRARDVRVIGLVSVFLTFSSPAINLTFTQQFADR